MTDLILAQQAERIARARKLTRAGDRVARRAEHWARLFALLKPFGGLAKFPTTGNAFLRSSSRRSALAARLYNEATDTLAGAR